MVALIARPASGCLSVDADFVASVVASGSLSGETAGASCSGDGLSVCSDFSLSVHFPSNQSNIHAVVPLVRNSSWLTRSSSELRPDCRQMLFQNVGKVACLNRGDLSFSHA